MTDINNTMTKKRINCLFRERKLSDVAKYCSGCSSRRSSAAEGPKQGYLRNTVILLFLSL